MISPFVDSDVADYLRKDLIEIDGVVKHQNDKKNYKAAEKGGLKYFLITNPEHVPGLGKSEMVTCCMMVKVGYLDDPKNCQGLSNFIQQMLLVQKLDKNADRNFPYVLKKKGFSLKVDVFQESSKFEFDCLASDFDKLFPLFIEMLLTPFKNKKDVINQVIDYIDVQFERRRTTKEFKFERLMAEYYPIGHPLSNVRYGNRKHLFDCRQPPNFDLFNFSLHFWENFYVLTNMFLIVNYEGSKVDIDGIISKCLEKNDMSNRKVKRPQIDIKLEYAANWAKEIILVATEYTEDVLDLVWSYPPNFNDEKTRPWQYLTRALCERRMGSIVSYFEMNDYGFEMKHRIIKNKYEFLYVLSIKLNWKGIEDMHHMVDCISMVERLFDDRAIYDGFQWSQVNRLAQRKSYNSHKIVKLMSEMCFNLDAKYLNIASKATINRDLKAEKEFLHLFRRERMQFFLTSRDRYVDSIRIQRNDKLNLFVFKKEQFVPLIHIGWLTENEWQAFYKADRNKYVPKKFDLIEFDPIKSLFPCQRLPDNMPSEYHKIISLSRIPKKIEICESSYLYYLPDESFDNPRVYLTFVFCIIPNRDLECKIANEIFGMLTNDYLRRKLENGYYHDYFIKYEYKGDTNAHHLSIEGYSDKLNDYLGFVLEIMEHGDMMRIENYAKYWTYYGRAFERRVKDGFNFALELTKMMRNNLKDHIFKEKEWERIMGMETMNKWWNELEIFLTKTVAIGNISEGEVIKMIRRVNNVIGPSDDYVQQKTPDFEKVKKIVEYGDYVLSILGYGYQDETSTVANVYYIEPPHDLKCRHLSQILSRLMKSQLFLKSVEFFDGFYGEDLDCLSNEEYLMVRVRSCKDSFICCHVDDKIDGFLEWFVKVYVDNLKDGFWQPLIDDEIRKIIRPHDNPAQERDTIASFISGHKREAFNYYVRNVQILRELKLDELKKFAREVLIKNEKRKKVSIQILGHNPVALDHYRVIKEDTDKRKSPYLEFTEEDMSKMEPIEDLFNHITFDSHVNIYYPIPKDFDPKSGKKFVINLEKFCDSLRIIEFVPHEV